MSSTQFFPLYFKTGTTSKHYSVDSMTSYINLEWLDFNSFELNKNIGMEVITVVTILCAVRE